MVLDFGGKALFNTEGLQQETGLLSGRYNQPGCTIKSVVFAANASGSKYTVTAGKRLFISNVTYAESTPGGSGELRDNGAGGTLKMSLVSDSAVDGSINVNFSTPIYFDTDVYWTETNPCGDYVTLTGWEESG